MQLVVFDIDDTLTRSMVADTECFVRSLENVFGFRNISTDWSRYRHVTDAGIIAELFEHRRGQPPTSPELTEFKKHFLEDLRRAVLQNPIEPVAGAEQLLTALRASSHHEIAMATGAWRASALIKLESARLDASDVHITSSDDHHSRADILSRAIAHSRSKHGGDPFSSVVYVGDGVWDAMTCGELEIPLLGVGTALHASKLKDLGAYEVFPDLTDSSSFFEALNELDQPCN